VSPQQRLTAEAVVAGRYRVVLRASRRVFDVRRGPLLLVAPAERTGSISVTYVIYMTIRRVTDSGSNSPTNSTSR
jgi:hypothetical protein